MRTAFSTLLTQQTGAILNVTLNRPDKANALSPTLLDELKAVLAAAAGDPSIAVVVLMLVLSAAAGWYLAGLARSIPYGGAIELVAVTLLVATWPRRRPVRQTSSRIRGTRGRAAR